MAVVEIIFSLLANFVLIPILVALLVYIGTELYSKKTGREISDEFHKMSLILASGVVISWVLFAITPAPWKLPLNLISIKTALGFVAFMFTLHYLLYWVLEIVLHDKKNTLTLGVAAGLVRSKITINVMESALQDDAVSSDSLIFSTLLSSAVMIFRNFIFVWIFGLALGLFIIPPNFFIASMGVMAILSAALSIVYYKHIGEIEKVEFSSLPLHGVGQFIVFFLFFYIVSAFLVTTLPPYIYYLFSAFAGLLYGYVQLFISSGFIATKALSPTIGMVAIIISTIFSMLSDIGHVALEQDKDTLIKIGIPIGLISLAGVLSLIFLI